MSSAPVYSTSLGRSLQTWLLASCFPLTHPGELSVASSSTCWEIVPTPQTLDAPGGCFHSGPIPGPHLISHMQGSQDTECHQSLPQVLLAQEASNASLQLPSNIRDNQPPLYCYFTRRFSDCEMPPSFFQQRHTNKWADNIPAYKLVTTALPFHESKVNSGTGNLITSKPLHRDTTSGGALLPDPQLLTDLASQENKPNNRAVSFHLTRSEGWCYFKGIQ